MGCAPGLAAPTHASVLPGQETLLANEAPIQREDAPNAPQTGYTVSGHVAEFSPCFGSQRGVTVALNPGGYSAQTDLMAGNFSFANIPDGNYTISIPSMCNIYGCWQSVNISVSGADVSGVNVCMNSPATNTPTNTPTSAPTQTFTPTPTNTPTNTPTSAPTQTFTPTPTNTPTNTPTQTSAPTATPTSSTHTIFGHVAEFPTCFGSQRGVTVALNPGGYSAQTDLMAGNFSFANIPDGNYTISIPSMCNIYGCWQSVNISVSGADVSGVNVCMNSPATNTPTSTPTAIPTVGQPMKYYFVPNTMRGYDSTW
ncbi:MAG TPA: hypothetical protein PL141_09915 [Thermoflexales bacterium]|nr:hypothetical protein [Thermoflexales bacterium]